LTSKQVFASVAFLNIDITDAAIFDPVMHMYMHSIGFPTWYFYRRKGTKKNIELISCDPMFCTVVEHVKKGFSHLLAYTQHIQSSLWDNNVDESCVLKPREAISKNFRYFELNWIDSFFRLKAHQTKDLEERLPSSHRGLPNHYSSGCLFGCGVCKFYWSIHLCYTVVLKHLLFDLEDRQEVDLIPL
jgi:hypothetical protein